MPEVAVAAQQREAGADATALHSLGLALDHGDLPDYRAGLASKGEVDAGAIHLVQAVGVPLAG